MTAPQFLLESIPTVSPLGLRFWDVATGTDVPDELIVTAYSQNNPARRMPAYRTCSGRYAFRGIAGLRAFETGSGDANFWNQLPAAAGELVVEVLDGRRRFQPILFTAAVPLRGLFTWTCEPAGLSQSPEGTVPLYSAPARPVPGGMAVVRADLRDRGHGVPAAWAVLEARLGGEFLARGLADDQGRVVLIFPYPEPLLAELESPPPGAQLPFTQQTWPLQFRARYGPLRPVPSIPDLCAALSQPVANLWANENLTEPFVEGTLRYGQELVLRTQQDASPLTTLAELLITPAGSPP